MSNQKLSKGNYHKFLLSLSILLSVSLSSYAEPEDSLRYAYRHILGDHRRMFTSPLMTNNVDLIVWGTTGASLLVLAPTWGNTRSVDERVEQGLNRDNVPLDNFMHGFTHIGDPPVLFGASLAGYGLGYWQDWTRLRTGSLHVFEGLVDTGIVAALIKILAGRRRPVDHPSNGPFLGPVGYFSDSENDSFVSGHAAMTFATATIISHESGSYWVGIPAYVVAGGVSYSRIYVEKHWLSDVIAGAVLGYSVGILVEHNRHSKPQLAGHFYPYVENDTLGVAWTRTF